MGRYTVQITKARAVPVEDLRAASAAVRAHCDGKSSNRWYQSLGERAGIVTDIATGRVVARVSYNGRVWEPGPVLQRTAEILDAHPKQEA